MYFRDDHVSQTRSFQRSARRDRAGDGCSAFQRFATRRLDGPCRLVPFAFQQVRRQLFISYPYRVPALDGIVNFIGRGAGTIVRDPRGPHHDVRVVNPGQQRRLVHTIRRRAYIRRAMVEALHRPRHLVRKQAFGCRSTNPPKNTPIVRGRKSPHELGVRVCEFGSDDGDDLDIVDTRLATYRVRMHPRDGDSGSRATFEPSFRQLRIQSSGETFGSGAAHLQQSVGRPALGDSDPSLPDGLADLDDGRSDVMHDTIRYVKKNRHLRASGCDKFNGTLFVMSFALGIDSYVGDNTKVKYWEHVAAEESVVTVGNYCSIASDVIFFADGNHRLDHASTYPFWERNDIRTGTKTGCGKGAPKIGHDTWIGERCMIMSGVSVGTGAAVCAGSVVTKDVPPYAIAAGNPAVIKKYRFDAPVIDQLLRSEWWNLPKDVVYEQLAPVQGDVRAWIDAAERANRGDRAV